MRVHRDINQLPAFQNAVITIGSFDGVHIGHQQIIAQINQLAQEINGESVVITFYPHPRLVLSRGQSDLKLLNTLEEKATLLEQYGIQHLVVVPFSVDFSNQEPVTYIEDFLVAKFKPSIIAIGYDHKFGNNRAGIIAYLRQYEQKHAFRVVEITKQEVADIAVSSTKVREALGSGAVSKARDLLGHHYSITGTVVKGLQIGNTIGFPTANVLVDYPHKLIPPKGIYAVEVTHQQQRYQGMLYIGNRPTINKNLEQTIEVNIFDFDQDIYGDELTVDFIAYLRGDKKLNGLAALQAALTEDKKSALAALSEYTTQ